MAYRLLNLARAEPPVCNFWASVHRVEPAIHPLANQTHAESRDCHSDSPLIALSLAIGNSATQAGEQLSLKVSMARYEAPFSPSASLTFPPYNPISAVVSPVAVKELPEKDATPPAWMESESNSPKISYLEKHSAIRSRLSWIAGENSTPVRKNGQVQVGYGPVYYDSYYDKPMAIFEGKGTRVEEPGCGYVKISFTF
jgi:hypothetical protein